MHAATDPASLAQLGVQLALQSAVSELGYEPAHAAPGGAR
jgi:hypothetical protein